MSTQTSLAGTSTRSLRIAIVGAGAIGRQHMALVGASAECILAAVVDPSPAAMALADRLGLPWFATLDELLALQPPDAVIIATPNALHADNALACIGAGVAALIEKPIAHTVAEAERLCRAVEAAGARVLIGHRRAHSPLMAKAREVVQQGRLGRVVAVTGTAMFFKREQTSGENPAYASHDDEDCYLVAGTLGSLAIPTMRLKTYASAQDRSWYTPFLATRLQLERRDPLVLQLAHFCALARGEVAALVSARDGLQNLRVIDAIAQSVHSGCLVEVQ